MKNNISFVLVNLYVTLLLMFCLCLLECTLRLSFSNRSSNLPSLKQSPAFSQPHPTISQSHPFYLLATLHPSLKLLVITLVIAVKLYLACNKFQQYSLDYISAKVA